LSGQVPTEGYRLLQGGGTKTAADAQRSTVSRFLTENALPDPDPFTSIAVFAGPIPSASPWKGYGTVTGYLHFDRVLRNPSREAA
jgi:hypothetical protein